MKRNKLFFFAAGVTLWLASCSKNELPINDDSKASANELMATSSSTSSSLVLGITGQPLSVAPYLSISSAEQISLLKKMGMKMYRIGVQSRTDNGEITVPYLYNPLKRAADAAGVKLLPVLNARTLDLNATTANSYRYGRALGAKFANKYKDHFTYYQISNELDNKCILPPQTGVTRDGSKESDYDLKKFKVIAAYLKGMNDGIKALDPDAKIIINAGWMHYQYLLMLERYGIKFDIIGYQWYSEMETLAERDYNITDITKFLSSKFTKPIWITEFNLRNHDGTTLDETAQQKFISSFITKCRNNPQVKVAMIYELFDRLDRQPDEAHYGIYKWKNPYTLYSPKLFAQDPVAVNSLVN